MTLFNVQSLIRKKKLLFVLLSFIENVLFEGASLEQQAKNLPPFNVPNTDISIDCIGCPTLVDGKVKSFWAGSNSFQKCYLCDCGEQDLRQRHNAKFAIRNFEALKYGFSPLHCQLRCFDWFLKAKTYR